ncbi:SIR2 family NAD-dependent protein deacylase [Rurimicrobium arvi]|uniref:protein acetyllysine N-acetyltransferase n=1 Tax=Rurimicrobium arvi TaxID=2049916 RepID=A0ABP8MXC2_9BACT
MNRKNLLVLTGAGISAESGLQTFRDGDGLWENHRVEDVATPEAWHRDPELVLNFYNMRRRACDAAHPNAAHLGLVSLEDDFEVRIVTQNIDTLHERAGSSNVLHLHGSIDKMRSERNEQVLYDYDRDLSLNDFAPDGGRFRPHVVWFGEAVPNIHTAAEWVEHWADIIVLIGSSLAVYPAAGLLTYAPSHLPKYVLDKRIPDVKAVSNVFPIEMPASLGIHELARLLREDA